MIDYFATELVVGEYLAPLRGAGVDTLILGCTHYPLLKGAIGRFMGPRVALVDSAETLAEAAARELAAAGLARPGNGAAGAGTAGAAAARGGADARGAGRLSFYLSDIPWKFAEIGARFLGQPIDVVEQVNLDEAEHAGRLVRNGKGAE